MKKELNLSKEELTPFVNLMIEGVEFLQEIGKATKDKKLTIKEGVSLFFEGKDVFQAVRELKGYDERFSPNFLTDQDFETSSHIIYDAILKHFEKVPFVREDIVSTFKIAKEAYSIISRKR